MPCPKCHTRKFARQIALLIGHGGAAKDGNTIFAVLLLKLLKAPDNGRKRFFPTDTFQRTLLAVFTHHRVEQAIRMIDGLISGSPFRAEHAMIEREIFTGLDPYHTLF